MHGTTDTAFQASNIVNTGFTVGINRFAAFDISGSEWSLADWTCMVFVGNNVIVSIFG